VSVLALALKRMELSHGTVPKDCPNGTLAARDGEGCPNGTSLRAVPTGHPRGSGTNGTPGTHGTNGTNGTGATEGTPGKGLHSYPCPDGLSLERWEPLRQGAVRFAEEWAGNALSLGWTHKELFAIAGPFARVDLQGAAWFIGDATVTAMTADTITLRTVSGATQRIYRRSPR
jgi:hypothetical protein